MLLPGLIFLTKVSGEGFAPELLPAGTEVSYSGQVSDTAGGSFAENRSVVVVTSDDLLQGGECAYTKTGPDSARLRLVNTYVDGDYSETEDAVLRLDFSQAGAGNYSSMGTYSGMDGSTPFAGNFTAEGTFTVSIPAVVEVPGVRDDFNDNKKDGSIWGVDTSLGAAGFSEAAERTSYASGSEVQSEVLRPLISDVPGYDHDWDVVVDLRNVFSPGTVIPEAGIGLRVGSFLDPQNFIEAVLIAYRQEDAVKRPLLAHIGGGAAKFAMVHSSFAAIRIRFDATRKIIHCDYDADGPIHGYSWTRYASFGIDGGGGSTGNAAWEMSGNQEFGISLVAFSVGQEVPDGAVSLDDFRITTVASAQLTAWQELHFGSASSPDAAMDFDKDRDGVVNLLEYAFGTHPLDGSTTVLVKGSGSAGLPLVSVERNPEEFPVIRVEYVRRKAATNPGVRYQVGFSNALGIAPDVWEVATAPEMVTAIDGVFERVIVMDASDPGTGRRFGRVRVVRD